MVPAFPIPGTLPALQHWLVQLVGVEATKQICWMFRNAGTGGSYVKIPRSPTSARAQRQAEADALIREWLSLDRIALQVALDVSTLQRRRKRIFEARCAA